MKTRKDLCINVFCYHNIDVSQEVIGDRWKRCCDWLLERRSSHPVWSGFIRSRLQKALTWVGADPYILEDIPFTDTKRNKNFRCFTRKHTGRSNLNLGKKLTRYLTRNQCERCCVLCVEKLHHDDVVCQCSESLPTWGRSPGSANLQKTAVHRPKFKNLLQIIQQLFFWWPFVQATGTAARTGQIGGIVLQSEWHRCSGRQGLCTGMFFLDIFFSHGSCVVTFICTAGGGDWGQKLVNIVAQPTGCWCPLLILCCFLIIWCVNALPLPLALLSLIDDDVNKATSSSCCHYFSVNCVILYNSP